MPVILTTPVQTSNPIVKQEIVSFTVDVKAMSANVSIENYDSAGNVVSRTGGGFSLIANGAPRFNTQLYTDLKAMLYKLSGESGLLLDGTVT